MTYRFVEANCNICASPHRRYLGKRIPRYYSLPDSLITDIFKCQDCGLIYPYPLPIPDQEQLDNNYSNAEAYFPRDISEERLNFYRVILQKINAAAKNKGILLDIGCGRGELLFTARQEGWNALGVDISLDFANYARRKFDVEVKVGNLWEMNFKPDSFDAISLVSVLDHAQDPKSLLLESNRIIKKGGIIFIEVMNCESLTYKIGDLYYRASGKMLTTRLSPTFPSYQLYGFSKKTLGHLLQTCGFKTIGVQIRGGVSRNEKPPKGRFKERILRFFRTACFIIADMLDSGQVLEICAKKEG